MTIYGTYRHPAVQARSMPAALLIAGSGPTDRNGNRPGIAGTVGTLESVADWLSGDGVASLRYKLGSGQTGAGPYAAHPETIDLEPFEQEASAALSFLAGRPGVDRNRLAAFGHSEGGLFVLLMVTGGAGPVPPIHAPGTAGTAQRSIPDVITAQFGAQAVAAQAAGRITPSQAAEAHNTLATAVQTLRTTGRVPRTFPPGPPPFSTRLTNCFCPERTATTPASWPPPRPPYARARHLQRRRHPSDLFGG